MNKLNLKPIAAAAVMVLAGPAFAIELDFSGSNIYMKFLDGDQRIVNAADRSGDTASGTDQGQWTEFELRIKARISKQVEAGVRLQSRSSNAYWTDFGGFGKEGATNGDQVNTQKWIKLRGAYVLLTPGYKWLDQALIGSSDWGQFDPFTVGSVRYIDRDNYNGLYFKGALPLAGASWEVGRLSLPNYLQSNYGQGPACCTSDNTQFNEAVYIGQVKGQLGPAKLTASYQQFNDHVLSTTDTQVFDGRDRRTFAKNRVAMLKAEGTALGVLDLKGAYYKSNYHNEAGVFDQPWINNPKSGITDNAYKLDFGLNSLPVPGLSINAQYFNIGAGFFSNTASRRENDVLLTEGSEAAWYGWGDPKWIGGAARDYQQSPASAKCFSAVGALCSGDSGLQGSANGLVDNAFMDFDEAPNESIQGWKGITVVANYEVAKIPLGFEYTRLDYNYNGSRAADSALSNFFRLDNDRTTTIFVAKAGYVVPVLGGIELGAKYKLVDDKNGFSAATANDDLQTKDSGYTLSAGNQLFRDLYGQLSYGQYSRKYTLTNTGNLDNKKNIWSVKLAYNLAGFETGLLAQWIRGDATLSASGAALAALNAVPLGTGALSADFKQYRMKAFVKAIF